MFSPSTDCIYSRVQTRLIPGVWLYSKETSVKVAKLSSGLFPRLGCFYNKPLRTPKCLLQVFAVSQICAVSWPSEVHRKLPHSATVTLSQYIMGRTVSRPAGMHWILDRWSCEKKCKKEAAPLTITAVYPRRNRGCQPVNTVVVVKIQLKHIDTTL